VIESGFMLRNLIQKKEDGFEGWGCNKCGWKYSNNVERLRPGLTLIKAAFDKHDCKHYPPKMLLRSIKS